MPATKSTQAHPQIRTETHERTDIAIGTELLYATLLTMTLPLPVATSPVTVMSMIPLAVVSLVLVLVMNVLMNLLKSRPNLF